MSFIFRWRVSLIKLWFASLTSLSMYLSKGELHTRVTPSSSCSSKAASNVSIATQSSLPLNPGRLSEEKHVMIVNTIHKHICVFRSLICTCNFLWHTYLRLRNLLCVDAPELERWFSAHNNKPAVTITHLQNYISCLKVHLKAGGIVLDLLVHVLLLLDGHGSFVQPADSKTNTYCNRWHCDD